MVDWASSEEPDSETSSDASVCASDDEISTISGPAASWADMVTAVRRDVEQDGLDWDFGRQLCCRRNSKMPQEELHEITIRNIGIDDTSCVFGTSWTREQVASSDSNLVVGF